MPLTVFAENWIEFHQEKWSQKSGKLKRKLDFSSSYYFDSGSLGRSATGDVTLWIKEVAANDKYYVKKGIPQSESTFRRLHLWCKLNRYEVLQENEVAGELNELMSEEIKPGSLYEKLHGAVCGNKESVKAL